MVLSDNDDSAETAVSDRSDDAEQTSNTRIDAAWRAMRERGAHASETSDASPASDTLDAATAAFIDTMLAEFLICPVWDDDGEPPAAAQRAQPKLVATDSGNALALFDSEDRLAAYLDAPSAFIALPGRDLFLLAAEHGLAVAFNPDVAQSAMTFAPATVAAIAELVVASEEESEVAAGDAMEARPPVAAPAVLLSALAARLAAAEAEISEGWLFEAAFADGAVRLILAVVPRNDADDETLSRLASELSRLGSAALGASGELSVAVFRASDPILARVRSVGVGLGASAGPAAH